MFFFSACVAASALRKASSCACARVIYVLCGSDAQGIEAANRLGERIYQKLVSLPH